MSLVLEVEYLTGVSFAAIGPESPVPDWPPQPDRVFSALVSSWAARGQDKQEADALEWLEKQPLPRVAAPEAEPRTSATSFVPPNDPRSDRAKNARDVFPPLRSRQARRFPASRPTEPIIRITWRDAAPEAATFAALQSLAHDTAYVGHSTSLTRCRFLVMEAPEPGTEATPQRRIYPGRFAELQREFLAGRRPQREPSLAAPRMCPSARANLFGSRWLLLEHWSRDMPDLRACAIVAKTIRDALLSGFRRIGLEAAIPEAVSGHTPDGKPTRAPHLAIIPLPHVGFPYADGHVLGFALIPPQGSGLLTDPDFIKALRKVAPLDGERRVLAIRPKEGTSRLGSFAVDFSLTQEPPVDKRSLHPSLYLGPALTYATVTPIALDRHLKQEGVAREDEIRDQIAVACRNIGLPAPVTVVADKHSALEGAPSAYPSGKSPDWMRWRLPGSLATRQLTHAVVRFAEPVHGPVILGAGRFFGIGLCRPIDGGARWD